jgi:hypothetical protein
VKLNIFLFLVVWDINAMQPQLCIEANEKSHLAEYHRSCEIDAELGRDRYMPKTQEELESLFERYQASEYGVVFFIDMTANIEGELSARCKDGDVFVLNKYLDHMRVSFGMINSFKDTGFREGFFTHFRDDFNRWILSMEDLVKNDEHTFTRELLYLPYTIQYVDNIISNVECLKDYGSIFEDYCRCCLDDTYEQSIEYKNMYAVIEQMLGEGINLEGN